MTTVYNDFSANIGTNEALSKLNGAFTFHDHSSEGQGGTIQGSHIIGPVTSSLICTNAINATNLTFSATINNIPLTSIFESNYQTIKSATNVSSTINNQPITSIFEPNGITVKNSTKFNNLTSDYFQKFYMPSEDIIVEKLSVNSLTGGNFYWRHENVATMYIYHPGFYNFSFDIKTKEDYEDEGKFSIYLNNEVIWEDLLNNTTYITKSKDLFISGGIVLIKIGCYNDVNVTYIRNIRLKGTPGEIPSFSIV